MKKVILSLVAVTLFIALFAGSWYATSFFLGDSETTVLSEPATDNENTTSTLASEASTTTVAPLNQASVVLSFPEPATLRDFWRSADAALDKLGANRIVRARASVYTTLAIYEAQRTAGNPSILSGSEGGLSEVEGLHAGGIVLAEIVDNSILRRALQTWVSDASSAARQTASVVIARASADGFSALGTTAPAGPETLLGWRPGGTVGGPASGLEPEFGKVTKILLPDDACPVPGAPLDRIERESQTPPVMLASEDVNTEVLLNIVRVANIIKNYLDAQGLERERSVYLAIRFTVVLYDALIETWYAKWLNMVDSPIGVVSGSNRTSVRSYPSYPSWEGVVIGAAESYVLSALGKNDTYTTIARIADEQIARNSTATDNKYSNTWSDSFSDIDDFLEANVHNWDADYTAGYELGSCVAKHIESL